MFSLLLPVLSFRTSKLRKYLAGKPIVIIEKGTINEYTMKKSKVHEDDLQQQSRENGTYNIQEIETAILEVSGKLSIQLKEQYKPVVKQDLDQVVKKGPIELILDGKIIIANLSYIHTQDWVEKQCQAHNIMLNKYLTRW